MWINKNIKLGSNDLKCSIRIKDEVIEIELPFVEDYEELLESKQITIDTKKYNVISVVDIAERHEKLFISCSQEKSKKTERGTNEQSNKSRKNS